MSRRITFTGLGVEGEVNGLYPPGAGATSRDCLRAEGPDLDGAHGRQRVVSDNEDWGASGLNPVLDSGTEFCVWAQIHPEYHAFIQALPLCWWSGAW